MSQPATEAPARPARRENVFTRKIGPLPMWAWVAIIGAVIVGWAYWKNRQSNQAAAGTTGSSATVPQFVNQTYTTVQPPAAPVPPNGDHLPDNDSNPPDKNRPPNDNDNPGTDPNRPPPKKGRKEIGVPLHPPKRRHTRGHPTHGSVGPGHGGPPTTGGNRPAGPVYGSPLPQQPEPVSGGQPPGRFHRGGQAWT